MVEQEKQPGWWKKEIFYQIYPSSFKDSNNDGIGDLQGIIQKLSYLKKLGITAIWLSPVYASPMVDNGYDISNYQKINPIFGDMQDFNELLEKSHKLGIKIILDLVVNHTSDEHVWFQEALKDPSSPYRNFYIFKKGTNGNPPNNWRSNFGRGSSWTKVPREENTYYHHVFSKRQPDLNWENKQTRQAIYKMINWWLEKGVDGFRIDAITFIKKDQDFASISPDGNDGLGKVKRKAENRPGIGKFLKELKEQTFKKYNAVTVGEASGIKYDELNNFIGNQGYFSMIFDFKYADIDVESGSEWYRRTKWTIPELREKIFKSQNMIQQAGWGANFLENHDQPRSVSKYIKDTNYQNEIGAKALGLLYFFLRGCPFIYQGQEIGMLNVQRKNINQFKDPSSIDNYYRAIEEGFSEKEALDFVNLRSRDNGRTPFQWNDKKNFGFNKGTNPWIEFSENSSKLNCFSENQRNNSTLNFYKKMIQLRNNSEITNQLIYGDFKGEEKLPNSVIGYYRGKDTEIVVNLSNKKQKIRKKATKVYLNTHQNLITESDYLLLKPYQGIVIGVD
ncbi:alpha-glucosidase [Ligilactobacillus acidipiscis]|uniref:alpha-glucosidase n=1 Tax=Ligilactobacillus acidipiscis TaxID=89059 RepID=UPI0023F640D5|nr:alpha-glucosidase [Ligilactobacillus acidipiscis]WEV57689.1 alpha-glucosidase [Ligilactobacillus acidipiscis]